jgi:hypothetical protein
MNLGVGTLNDLAELLPRLRSREQYFNYLIGYTSEEAWKDVDGS